MLLPSAGFVRRRCKLTRVACARALVVDRVQTRYSYSRLLDLHANGKTRSSTTRGDKCTEGSFWGELSPNDRISREFARFSLERLVVLFGFFFPGAAVSVGSGVANLRSARFPGFASSKSTQKWDCR